MVSADLELVNEYNNCYFISLINVLNGIVNGEKISKYELNSRIAKEVEDNNGYFSGEIADEVFRECKLLFDITDDNTFKIRSSASIPVCLSEAERIYIRAIISSKYGKLFLSEKETAELIDALGDVPDIPLNDYLISVPSRNREYNDKFIADIRLLLIAIREGKEIIYSNKTRTAVYENMHGYPIRIEYSALYDLFQLSLWSSEEKRPVKVNIHTMYDIGISDNIWNEAQSPSEMMKNKLNNEPVVMELSSKNNTYERANIMFSMYKIETEDNSDDKHRIKLFYYQFDENEIINTILSFGPYVKVISPTAVVDKIKERIRGSHAVN